MKANIPVVPKVSNALSMPTSSQTTEPPAPATPPYAPSPPPVSEFAPEDPPVKKPEKCVQKLNQHIADLLAGHGHTSNLPSDPVVTPGIQVPTVEPTCVLEGEGQSEWLMWTDFVANLMEEHEMAAKIEEAEALKP